MQLSGARVLAIGLCLGIGLCLAACAPPSSKVQPESLPLGDVTPGFVNKEPDTCKSAPQRGLIGQQAGMLRTVAASGPVRMIMPGTVYDQEEYRSDRANVFVDGAGIITSVTCG